MEMVEMVVLEAVLVVEIKHLAELEFLVKVTMVALTMLLLALPHQAVVVVQAQ
jgi:hypothetical protein